MGLRLCFRLIARGPFVREDRSLLADLASLLTREGLVAMSMATLRLEGHTAVTVPLSGVQRAISERARPCPTTLELSGLRTAEHFPNPFWKYTQGEAVIEAWMTARHVTSPPAERRFELEFVEPDFLADSPAITPYRLEAQLKTVVGTSLTIECVSLEPEGV